MKRGWRKSAGAVALVLAGAAGGWFGRERYTAAPPGDEPHAVHQNRGFQYINPLLECETGPADLDPHELAPFSGEIEDLVQRLAADGLATHVSVYFRDLNNGPWFGINERERFSPASLLKVPLLMAWLEVAEANPGVLDAAVPFPVDAGPDLNLIEHFRPAKPIEAGQVYTVRELLRRMIVYSDNNAWRLLNERMDQNRLFRILKDLDIAPGTLLGDDQTPVKTYATFFRLLYNASYLSRASSESALALLGMSAFRTGLPGALPAEIRVAHKFGERDLGGPPASRQLHDCGIVYHPRRPYLLCVMTRGGEPEGLLRAIREISGEVYRHVERNSSALSHRDAGDSTFGPLGPQWLEGP